MHAIHEQLERNPPTPKFHVIFETVGGTDVPLYTHCEKYLAHGGVFVSVGVMPYDGPSTVTQALRYFLESYGLADDEVARTYVSISVAVRDMRSQESL